MIRWQEGRRACVCVCVKSRGKGRDDGGGGLRQEHGRGACNRKLPPAYLDLLAVSAHQHAEVLDHVGELVEATVLAEHGCCVTHQDSRKTATEIGKSTSKYVCARGEDGRNTHTRAHASACARTHSHTMHTHMHTSQKRSGTVGREQLRRQIAAGKRPPFTTNTAYHLDTTLIKASPFTHTAQQPLSPLNLKSSIAALKAWIKNVFPCNCSRCVCLRVSGCCNVAAFTSCGKMWLQ